MKTIKLNVKISKSTIIVLSILLLAIIISCVAKYIYDQTIIRKTEQTLQILKESYAKTIKAGKLNWENGTITDKLLAKEFVKNLPLKKDCGFNKNKVNECFPLTIHFRKPLENLHVDHVSIGDYYKVLLDNNIGVAFKILSPTCNQVRNRCGTIFIDVNGSDRGPNRFGDDLYDFGIYKDEIRTYNIDANHIPRCINGTGQGCAEYMLQYRNRNYKKFIKIYKKTHPIFKKQDKK